MAALLAVAAESAPATAGAAIRLRAARALDELSEWSSVLRVLGPVGDGGSTEELAERDALLAHAAYALGDLGAARQHLAAASARAVDPASLAGIRRTVETASFLVNVEGSVGPAVAELQAGIAVQPAGSAGDRDLSVLLTAIVLLATGQGDPGVVATGLDEAFDAGRYRTASDRARVLQFLLLMSSSAEATLAFLLAQTARFEAAGVGSVALEFQADAVLAAILAGRPDQAITLADELAELPAPVRPRQASGTYRARALTLRGAFDQAADQLRSIVATASPDFFGRGEGLIAQAELAYWSGRPTVAAKLAEAALEIPAPVPVAHVQPQLLRCWARSDLGLDPETTLASPLTPSQAGAPPELEGLVAWHAGDAEAARAAFDQAAEAWAGFFEPRRLVCQWAAGESVRRSGDREVASRRLAGVLEAATAMGFEPLAARVRRSLRLAGVRTSGVTRTQVLAAGGLTGRERELVALVEHGLTNVEIARRLGLGRPTVARILASAMTKLGVNSRAQLAAIVPD
jgi:DNA-binding CsgD family transcriptional regulator